MPEPCIACGSSRGGINERLDCYTKEIRNLRESVSRLESDNRELNAYKKRIDDTVIAFNSFPMSKGGMFEELRNANKKNRTR